MASPDDWVSNSKVQAGKQLTFRGFLVYGLHTPLQVWRGPQSRGGRNARHTRHNFGGRTTPAVACEDCKPNSP